MSPVPKLSDRPHSAKRGGVERAFRLLFGLPGWAYIACVLAGLAAAFTLSLMR